MRGRLGAGRRDGRLRRGVSYLRGKLRDDGCLTALRTPLFNGFLAASHRQETSANEDLVYPRRYPSFGDGSPCCLELDRRRRQGASVGHEGDGRSVENRERLLRRQK